MTYDVYLSLDAEEDILSIWRYVAQSDSSEMADRPIDELQNTCLTLEEFPERGHCPPELERVHVREYREIHYKPYRIIYRLNGEKVVIYFVLDGRRNLQDLLIERSMRPEF